MRARRLGRAARNRPLRQGRFPFLEARERRQRRFKWSIIALTGLACGGLLGGTRVGRHGTATLFHASRDAVLRAIGGETGRDAIEARWREQRGHGVAVTRDLVRQVYAESSPPLQRLMRYAGMDPDSVLLRWGNYDQTLLLPSRVFAADDTGRSYRLRPNVRSVWLRYVTLPRGLHCFFLVPESPQLPGLMKDLGIGVIPGSRQSTNSWGCRGPEPDPGTALRGLVLGDSFMQAIFIGDDETPSACLQRYLREHLSTSVSILNTGHLGYSPEQYYFTLVEYCERLRPRFVILSICNNDFGSGDWSDSAYWVGEIRQYCRTRGLICLTVPVTAEHQVTAPRRMGDFQGRLSNLSLSTSLEYLDPTEEFVDENLRVKAERRERGQPFLPSPLFNMHLGDGHFSAAGSNVWARAVGRRLILLLNRDRSTAPTRVTEGPGRSGSGNPATPSGEGAQNNGRDSFDSSFLAGLPVL